MLLTPAVTSAKVASWTAPQAAVVAAEMEMAGVVPLLDAIGAVPVTAVTDPLLPFAAATIRP